MNTKQKSISVIAICLSIIVAAAILTYRPQTPEEEFKFPVGIPPSLGSISSVWVGDEQLNTIHVSGSGSFSAKANQATLILGAWTLDFSAADAVEDNAEVMNAVIGAIEGLGIPEENIETVTYTVSTEWDWENREIDGYRVTNLVQIRLDEEYMGMIGEVIDAASDAGANSVQGITFGLSDEAIEELETKAYVQALNDARGKADLIADTLGISVTGVYSVSESVYYPYVAQRGFDVAASYEAAPTPILEGTLSVSVSVQASFTFE
ncbi:MAG: SIMPL domain-containing protein [Candidatus Bathyarchaeota archaeon]|nr:MAG: SIMPL domain-containing protein [Candidatus Bathyarchaeota archaeon]